MAEGQSPENSPPAPPPPSLSSPSSNNQTTSPPPTSDNQPTSPPPSPTLAPPPEQQEQSPPPPPPESSSSPPPPPSDSSTPSSQSQSQPPPSQSPPQQSDTKGNNKGNDGSGNGGGNNASPPPPPSTNSDRSSHSPPKSLAPPTSNGGFNTSSNDRPDMGVVIGLVAAAGLLFVVMILLCVCCFRKKKKKKSKLEQMPYYGSNAFPAGNNGGDQYFNSAATQQQQQQQQQQQHYNQNDYNGNLPPPPGTMGTNWVNSPPPPPPPGNWQPMPSPLAPVSGGGNAIGSGEMSSNYSSGPYAPSLPPPHPSVALGFNKSTFTYEELAAATQGFSKDRLLGQGGFGYVHKGVLPNGKEIAVKSLKAGSGQGEREFQAEVEIISRVHHRHLVSLVGYCSTSGGQRMLVYEFLPNDTLEFHLHVIRKTGTVMDWPTRLKIALGSAKGLAYLHEDCHPKIIHRDIKASNILLDLNFEAKVADFGLAKLSQDNNTHVSTRVMGTFGYLAPEYAASGKLTDKSDVFSFGVMLLELITGRRPVDLSGDMEDSLVDWARPLCMNAAQDGEYGELVDPFLENQYEPYEMARMVACAAAAVRHSGRRRPKMSQIVRILEGDASLDDLNDGVKPGQGSYMGSSGGDGSSDYETGTYGAEMKKFRKVRLDMSRDYGASSEYGGTSEYGLDPSSSSSEEMHTGGGYNKSTATSTRRV